MPPSPAAAADAQERADWLRLLLTEGVGRESARRLLAAFGGPGEVLAASSAARQRVAGPAAAALSDPPPEWEGRLAAMEAWLSGGPDRALWTLGDAAYPRTLLQTADPPLLLFAQGDPAVLARPALAIVGSRNATAQGLDNARAFARHLSEAGWTVVSGLARGIDAAAHEGALLGEGGTIAVIGTGPDRVYPSAHRALAHRIAGHGLILSEYAPGTPPLPGNFPLRNRLIATLSQGTLVAEAALQSGSLITARLAAESGREVFAIPGSIHAPQSRGCHALIRQGAKLVETAQDILEELAPQTTPPAPGPAPRGVEDPLLDAMGHDPVTLDALSARTGWPTATLNARLLELELDGRVARLPGGLFQRRHVA
jgi:DNA processing protein